MPSSSHAPPHRSLTGSVPHSTIASMMVPNGTTRAVESGSARPSASADDQPGSRKGGHMSPEPLFQIHLVLGYVAWLLCLGVYVLPKLEAMDRVEAHRAIATLHSFRFF